MFFSRNMFYKKCKKAILVVMNAKQRRFWTFWEVKHELCAARLESLFVFLVWHPQKFKVDSRSQFSTNRAEFFWVEFFMNVNNSLDFETKVYFWTTLVNMKLHGYTIFRWCLHHFATLSAQTQRRPMGFFVNKFRLCKWFVFSVKEKFIQFFLSFA